MSFSSLAEKIRPSVESVCIIGKNPQQLKSELSCCSPKSLKISKMQSLNATKIQRQEI